MIARIYFKRTGKFPFIWSIDKGHIDTQRVVKQYHFGPKCKISGGHALTTRIENSPKVFVKVKYDRLTFKNGEAYFV